MKTATKKKVNILGFILSLILFFVFVANKKSIEVILLAWIFLMYTTLWYILGLSGDD